MELKLPRLGEGAESGSVVGILVKEGDRVKKNQPVIEIENEKAVASIPSTAAGIVKKIHLKEGDSISVGQSILTLEESDEKEEKTDISVGAGSPRPKKDVIETEPTELEQPEPEQIESPAIPGIPPPAAPSVRRLANELGIDLNRVKGSERGGRIVLADINNYIQRLQQIAFGKKKAVQPVEKPVMESIDFSKWGPVKKKPLTGIRKTISRRMHESWSAIPHVTQFDEADITDIMELRKKYKKKYEQKKVNLTLTPLILKVLVNVLQKYPIFNSSLDEATDEIIFKEYYHIGIAVDTEAGLIVPVLRDIDKKGLVEIAKELDILAENARNRKFNADDLKGSTFTISNQGGIGGGHFTPIINRPDVAILGLGRGVLKPVVKNKKTLHRMILPLCLSYDHRVIDGADAARFMVDLIKVLEEFDEKELKI